ncbi:metallophosphoesterase [Synechococcus sp. CCY 9618]|uniref:metallophosphoesterase n=1 Tax=Synechococcus sp. CCY 9618 TaxID=2815602 RepID=UPI001C21BE46|nr:metallophosphoesterase [Synechococcus sp. CCY 9618]
MRILQLSDPHLLSDPAGRCRGRPALPLLRHGLGQGLDQLQAAGEAPEMLLISGDLCQDETWGGYVRLGDLLEEALEGRCLPVALLAGNHDHPALLRAALGRRAVTAPAVIDAAPWRLLLLDSHRSGDVAGELGPAQLAWLGRQLAAGPTGADTALLVAVHHPPVAIGDAGMDAIGLRDGEALLDLLRPVAGLRGLVFGHVHQHWQGTLPGRPEVSLLGCPSTLCGFGPVQPCPLGRADDPGGRWLDLGRDGMLRQRLLRWGPVDGPSLLPCNGSSPFLP